MGKAKFVKETIKNNKDIQKEIMVNYYLNLNIKKKCRLCVKIVNFHKKNDEQDINKIYELSQYCPNCKKIIVHFMNLLDKKEDEL